MKDPLHSKTQFISTLKKEVKIQVTSAICLAFLEKTLKINKAVFKKQKKIARLLS